MSNDRVWQVRQAGPLCQLCRRGVAKAVGRVAMSSQGADKGRSSQQGVGGNTQTSAFQTASHRIVAGTAVRRAHNLHGRDNFAARPPPRPCQDFVSRPRYGSAAWRWPHTVSTPSSSALRLGRLRRGAFAFGVHAIPKDSVAICSMARHPRLAFFVSGPPYSYSGNGSRVFRPMNVMGVGSAIALSISPARILK